MNIVYDLYAFQTTKLKSNSMLSFIRKKPCNQIDVKKRQRFVSAEIFSKLFKWTL